MLGSLYHFGSCQLYVNRSMAFPGFLTSDVPRDIRRGRGEIGRSEPWNPGAIAYGASVKDGIAW